MPEKLDEILTRIQAEIGTEASAAHVSLPLEDLRHLIQSFEILRSEKEELRRKVDQQSDIVEAATGFLDAYREKYRNFSGGGIRPTAILLREVKMIWGAVNNIRGPAQSEF